MALHKYSGHSIATILALLALCSCRCAAFLCQQIDEQKSNCRCQFDDPAKTVIDFKPISRNNGTPEFPFDKYSTEISDFEYAFNPCYPFDGQDACKGKSVCQKYTKTPPVQEFNLGDRVPTAWTPKDENTIEVTYTSTAPDPIKTSLVNFTCDKTAVKQPIFKFTEEQPTNTYKFTVNTCLACLEAVPGCERAGGGGGSSLTTGGVLCIIFTVLVVVYIVGGILFQKFGRGATGKELVPNYGFWSDFPALIKDGVLLMVSPCRKDDGYSSI